MSMMQLTDPEGMTFAVAVTAVDVVFPVQNAMPTGAQTTLCLRTGATIHCKEPFDHIMVEIAAGGTACHGH